jgi:hypothetical protein
MDARASTTAVARTTPNAGRPIAIVSSTARAVLGHGSDRSHGHDGRRAATISPRAPT